MAEWFYRDALGKEFGPFGGGRLLELVRDGVVSADTEVRKDDSPWTFACMVNGLWQAVGRPGVEFRCPHCQASIGKPPTRCEACHRDVAKAVGKLVHRPATKASEVTWRASATNTAPSGSDKPKAPPLMG